MCSAARWLIWWTARSRPDEVAKGEVIDHVWDGDLQERNNPMPRWWLILFLLTIVFCFLYFVLYPALGPLRRRAGLEQARSVRAGNGAAPRRSTPRSTRHSPVAMWSSLPKIPKALALGHSLFLNNCINCHGSDARGAIGFPNLTDNDWLHGGAPQDIVRHASRTAARASCRRSARRSARRASMKWSPTC